jgi:hypothetical protein
MDWIEQRFGVSPDAGDGGLERLIALAAAALLVVFAARTPVVRRRLASLRRGRAARAHS